MDPAKKKRLGELLINGGLITETQLAAALSEQRKWGGRLGRTLVEMGLVDEESMVLALSRQLGLSIVDLDKAAFPKDITHLLPLHSAERYGIFPIGLDPARKVLKIATADPTNLDAQSELRFQAGYKIEPWVATSSSIDRAIRRYYYGDASVSSPTATPADLGVNEATFEMDDATGSSAPTPELIQRLEELERRMSLLERHSANQVRALRTLVELLLQKKVINKEEYLARTKKSL